jgi:hypothetical protein
LNNHPFPTGCENPAPIYYRFDLSKRESLSFISANPNFTLHPKAKKLSGKEKKRTGICAFFDTDKMI